MIISTPIFEAYLKCPSKCWFLFLDKKGDANIYSDFLGKRNNAYRAAGIERLMAKIQPGECVVKPSIPLNIKIATWLLAIDLVARKETFESCLHAVERIPTDGRGNQRRYAPTRGGGINRNTLVLRIGTGWRNQRNMQSVMVLPFCLFPLVINKLQPLYIRLFVDEHRNIYDSIAIAGLFCVVLPEVNN